jgi:glutamate transport system permease protein
VIFIVINFALSSLATRLSKLLSFRSKGRARDETLDGIAAAEPEGTLSR